MRDHREQGGEIAARGAIGDGRHAHSALPIVGQAQESAGEKRSPACDHRLSRLRLDGIDPGKDLPDDAQAPRRRRTRPSIRACGCRRHAAAPSRDGARSMFEAEMAEQLVLDGDHVRQQQAVGVARPSCSNGDVVDDRARVAWR